MKRILYIFTVIVLLLSCAFAEDEKEFLFRGVEWGASLNDVKNSFYDPIRWELPEYGSCFGMDYWTKGKGTVYSGDICMSVQSQLTATDKLNVAGIKASVAVLRFAKISNESDPKFIMGEYQFASGDAFDNYFDLKQKLIDLYGEEAYSTVKVSTAFDYYTVWKDSKEDAICLCMHGDSMVALRYISSQIDALLSEAAEKYQNDKNSNYDGL